MVVMSSMVDQIEIEHINIGNDVSNNEKSRNTESELDCDCRTEFLYCSCTDIASWEVGDEHLMKGPLMFGQCPLGRLSAARSSNSSVTATEPRFRDRESKRQGLDLASRKPADEVRYFKPPTERPDTVALLES